MVGWNHRLNGHESEQTPGDGEGQGSLACYNPWGCKELDTTEQLNNNRSNTEMGSSVTDMNSISISVEGIKGVIAIKQGGNH